MSLRREIADVLDDIAVDIADPSRYNERAFQVARALLDVIGKIVDSIEQPAAADKLAAIVPDTRAARTAERAAAQRPQRGPVLRTLP